jgi:hypothetical protein
VPATSSSVKLQKGKLLSEHHVTIVLEAMRRLSSLISALGLILPR